MTVTIVLRVSRALWQATIDERAAGGSEVAELRVGQQELPGLLQQASLGGIGGAVGAARPPVGVVRSLYHAEPPARGRSVLCAVGVTVA